ncbi:uncharacterized protein LOC100905234 [Galendromus occidentalis]|uniref:Uncharacterized protein LOC100905234 n=1 Tax=Galendromus occidentalis TaxID=34638 RepID=A0AAJ6QSR2_9ACAR|nr:uncharacterized protein LOC100905234 [Galendromus occidentalis]
MEFPHHVTVLMLVSLCVGGSLSLNVKLPNFSFENGSSLPPQVKFGPPPTCPGNATVCSFDDIRGFSKDNVTRTSYFLLRKTIMKLLDVLETAAQTTGLVKGKLFSSEGAENDTKARLLSRRRRSGGFVSLCSEISKPNEYPEIGKNKDGKWRYLTGRQVVHSAYCVNEGGACSGDIKLNSPREISLCAQKYGFSPMIVFDEESQKFDNDQIVVPCGCQCQFGNG